MRSSRGRIVALLVAVVAVAGVLAVATFAALSLQSRPNPSGQTSGDANERCSPSPCGAPDGFEVDVTSIDTGSGHLVLTLTFRNHTKPQLFEAVSYRHTSPADFTLKTGGQTLKPIFDATCPDWPELDVPRGAASGSRVVCFDVGSSSGAVLVWDPDLGVIPRPVSIALS